MRSLTVLYDETCGFCVRCAKWIEGQPTFIPVRCVPANAEETQRQFPGVKGSGEMELVAVDAYGGIYRGTDALLLILWALRGYREWARRLSTPSLKPWTKALFWSLSKGRHRLSGWLGWTPSTETLRNAARERPPSCTAGTCSHAALGQPPSRSGAH